MIKKINGGPINVFLLSKPFPHLNSMLQFLKTKKNPNEISGKRSTLWFFFLNWWSTNVDPQVISSLLYLRIKMCSASGSFNLFPSFFLLSFSLFNDLLFSLHCLLMLHSESTWKKDMLIPIEKPIKQKLTIFSQIYVN